MDYSALLTPEQKQALLEQRIQQFAAEAYQHQLNKQIAETAGDTEAIELAENALIVLDQALNIYQGELRDLS